MMTYIRYIDTFISFRHWFKSDKSLEIDRWLDTL